MLPISSGQKNIGTIPVFKVGCIAHCKREHAPQGIMGNLMNMLLETLIEFRLVLGDFVTGSQSRICSGCMLSGKRGKG